MTQSMFHVTGQTDGTKPEDDKPKLTTAGKPPVLTFETPSLGTDYCRALIIGEQGTGKTRLATSILDVPWIEGVFYIDVDRGIATGRNSIREHEGKLHYKQVDQDKVIQQMTAWLRWLRFATDREKAREFGLPYIDTVVIDSVSFLGDRTIGKLGEASKVIETGVKPPNNQLTSIAEWNLQKSLLEGWIDQINALPCHFIVTCHNHTERNERLATWMPVLRLPWKVSRSLPSYFRQVHWLSIEQVPVDPKKPAERKPPTHVLLCRPEGKKEEGFREAKDCSDTLPFTIENPTMSKLFGYIFPERS